MLRINHNSNSDLRISPKIATVFFGTLAILLTFTHLPHTDPATEVSTLFLILLLSVFAIVIGVLDQGPGLASRWLAVAAAVALVGLGLGWLDQPGFLVFVPIPVILAAGLINVSAATLSAVVETVVLLTMWHFGIKNTPAANMAVVLASIWMMWGITAAIYQPVHQITRGFDDYFQRSYHLLEDANKRKLVLEQALKDLARANRELTLLNERLGAMRVKAEEAQKAKAVFVAKISHELRTPLNMIIGLIDTLTETPDIYGQKLPAELLEDLDIVHRNSQHLASMINDVLDLSQTEAGYLALHREWVNLAEDINTALTVVQPLLDKKRLQLKIDIPNELPHVYCDKIRIRQVILNLVSNAARYTETGGITVAAHQEEQHIVVNVVDTGPGISAENLEQIFEPFCQGTSSMWRDQGGTGLGLSISQQFIKQHKGQIWVESKLGIGSTFSFKLPIAPSTASPGSAQRWINEDWVFFERTDWPAIPQLPYNQRIILCDETGDLYPQMVRQFDDIEFIDTIDLAQTIETLQRFPAHVVIVNTISAKSLRPAIEQARREIPDTPIIGCTFPPKADHFLEAGAVDYLIKPVLQNDLKEAIQALDTPVKRILIVDDNPDFRQLLERMLLIIDASLEISAVSNGQAALELLPRQPQDLVLLDVLMPEMSGWDVLVKKREDETMANVPVIMITAEDLIGQPMVSDVLVATMAQGVSVNQLLQCSLQYSKLFLNPNPAPDPMPELVADGAPV